MSTFRIFTAIHHFLRTIRSKNGFGIHSPFAFSFITDVLNPSEKSYYYSFQNIEKMRQNLLSLKKDINLKNKTKVSINKVANTSATNMQHSQMLFRIALAQKSRNIIELGTSLGISSAYLASTSQKAQVYTIDHDAALQQIAKVSHNILELENITYISGDFKDCLSKELENLKSIDLIYFDGDNNADEIIKLFNTALPYASDKTVFIFHNIHWSKNMYQAWQNIYSHNNITASFELYDMGIIFFNKELKKQHFYA